MNMSVNLVLYQALLTAARGLSTQLHKEEERGIEFRPQTDRAWEKLTSAIEALKPHAMKEGEDG